MAEYVAENWCEFKRMVAEEAADDITNVQKDWLIEEVAQEAVQNYINDNKDDFPLVQNVDFQEIAEEIMWDYVEDDYVDWDNWQCHFTGNADGSKTCNSWKSERNIQHIIWDADFSEDLETYGYSEVPCRKGPEAVEVLAYELAVDEYKEDLIDLWRENVEDEVKKILQDHLK